MALELIKFVKQQLEEFKDSNDDDLVTSDHGEEERIKLGEDIEANSPSADHDEEVFSDTDDDEMPEIRIYDKSNEGIFEKASYDDDG
ncbi:hypothetical protein Tco_1445212, partial [Tanacetum coccineum]